MRQICTVANRRSPETWKVQKIKGGLSAGCVHRTSLPSRFLIGLFQGLRGTAIEGTFSFCAPRLSPTTTLQQENNAP